MPYAGPRVKTDAAKGHFVAARKGNGTERGPGAAPTNDARSAMTRGECESRGLLGADTGSGGAGGGTLILNRLNHVGSCWPAETVSSESR
jgi:hypothetical protein